MIEPSTDALDLEQRVFDVLWGVQLSARYHSRREAFFERWSRVTSAAGVLFGSTAIAGFFKEAHLPAGVVAFMGLVVAVASTVDLVVGTAACARRHEELRRRFLKLEAEIRRCVHPEPEDCVAWTDERLAIEMDEPAVYRGLYFLCWDELARATRGIKDRVRLRPIVRATAQWKRWDDLPAEDMLVRGD